MPVRSQKIPIISNEGTVAEKPLLFNQPDLDAIPRRGDPLAFAARAAAWAGELRTFAKDQMAIELAFE